MTTSKIRERPFSSKIRNFVPAVDMNRVPPSCKKLVISPRKNSQVYCSRRKYEPVEFSACKACKHRVCEDDFHICMPKREQKEQ